MKTLLLMFSVFLVGCGGAESQPSEAQLANFSGLYKTWTLSNNYTFEWAGGVSSVSSIMVHPSDELNGVNFCDCSVYGYGNLEIGQVRLNSCDYRGNPALSASKCTVAINYSNFNFTKTSATMNLCFQMPSGAYTACEIAQ